LDIYVKLKLPPIIANEIPVSATAERPALGYYNERLEYAGFSRAVWPNQQVEAGSCGNFQFFQVAEIRYR